MGGDVTSTFRVLDQLESVIRKCARIPLTSQIFIDADRLLSILEKFRTSLPEELRQAHYLTQENHRILREAHEKGEAIVAEAAREAQAKVQESEITRMAQEHAEELIAHARVEAKEVRDNADAYAKEMREGLEAYARDVLGGLETELERLASIVHNNKGKLERTGQPPVALFKQIAV